MSKVKSISLLLALISVMMIMPISTSAATVDNAVAPLWQNTAIVICNIVFPGDGYGYAEGHVMGHSTVNKITADVYVYKQVGSSWEYVAEKHETVNNCSLTISCPFSPEDGTYYRADYTFVVTKNGVDETITETKFKTYNAS